MKAVSQIRNVLFAISILGAFANYAQNDYGMSVIMLSDLLIASMLLIATLMIENSLWKEKRSKTIFIIAAVVVIFVMNICNVVGVYEIGGTDIIGIIMFTLLGIVLVETGIVIVADKKLSNPSQRSYALESFGGCLLFLFFFLKGMHWAGASPMLLVGSGSLCILYISRVVKSIRIEFSKGKTLALFAGLFYLSSFLAIVAYLFKNMHWPGSNFLVVIASALLIFILIPLIFNFKFSHGEEKIGVRSYLKRANSITLFVFIFTNYFAFFMTLQVFGIGPRFYSLQRPPALQKMIDKSTGDNDPKVEAYFENYDNFIHNRQKADAEK
ncbi:MAG: hypothetical protein ACXVOH_00690 [Bacteroidia bacterium]